ncbi:MAG: hypothetical protein IJ970_00755 [Mycoplasmataceae bacterium]|nr:hypothetical protein [Mycoplasmataceae bacterium]
MKINFKSIYKNFNDEEPNIIEFTTNLLENYVEDNFNIVVFEENRNEKKIKNRIEYNENEIKIYSGISSLACKLNEVVKNNFVVQGMESNTFYIYTKLIKIKIDNNYLNTEYLVSHSNEFKEFTKINLTLNISD